MKRIFRKGYVSLEVIIIVFALLTAGIGGISLYIQSEKEGHTQVIVAEDQIFEAVKYENNNYGDGNMGGMNGSLTDAPGLYNSSNVLMYTWNELVDIYGFDVEKDYEGSETTPGDLLRDNADLKDGVKLIVPEGVTRIGKQSFVYVPNLKSIILPDSVLSIGDYAFSECTSLRAQVSENTVIFGRYPFEYIDTLCYDGPTVDDGGQKRFGAGKQHIDEDNNDYCDECKKHFLSGDAYAIIYTHPANGKTLTFIRTSEPIAVGDSYQGQTIENVYSGFENQTFNSSSDLPWNEVRNQIKSVDFVDMMKPISTAYWFQNFSNCQNFFNLSNLNTSEVTDMNGMFRNVYFNFNDYNFISAISNLNTSKVESMNYMFAGVNPVDSTMLFRLNLKNWDVSQLKDMSYMFRDSNSSTKASSYFYLDLSDWNTSKVQKMNSVFANIGSNSSKKTTTFHLDLTNWNTKEVVDMESFLHSTAPNATSVTLKGVENFNTSKVSNMRFMFYYWGNNVSNFSMDLSNWDTSEATNMEYMFSGTGNNSTSYYLNLKNWDTSKVSSMREMFSSSGRNNATSWRVEGLEEFETTNLTNVYGMFSYAYENGTSPIYLDLSGWEVGNITDSNSMFRDFACQASSFSLNLSNWNVSNITSMSSMFRNIARYSSSFSLNLSNWDTSKVKSMDYMFYYAGKNAYYTLNLSNWNVDSVTKHNYFNSGVTSKIIAPTWK